MIKYQNQYLVIFFSFIFNLLDTFMYLGGLGKLYLLSNVSSLNVLILFETASSTKVCLFCFGNLHRKIVTSLSSLEENLPRSRSR